MKLSDDEINEFQSLYRRHIGRELSKGEAVAEAALLIDLVKLLAEPIDSDQDVAFVEEYRWGSQRSVTRINSKSKRQPG